MKIHGNIYNQKDAFSSIAYVATIIYKLKRTVMKKSLFIVFLIFTSISIACSQTYFRSGIFLHHSTGLYIWGPNPDGLSHTTIPAEMHQFNINHLLTGSDSITLNEEWWSPSDNEWYTQHQFFEGNTAFTDINDYLNNNKIIIVKSCFPSSEIDSWGQPSDTATDPTYKSVYNYKWHWRHIINVMKNHPDNFFVIWTNAPREVNSTTVQQAALSKLFCTWAKDTLAEGLDPFFGAFPHNVYVFDYFNKITGTDGIEPVMYATAPYDSHPNGAATDFIAPQFVNEIFTAALAYEQFYTAIREHKNFDVFIFPNPVNDKLYVEGSADFSFEIIDITGNVIKSGKNKSEIGVKDIPKGIYFVRIITEKTEIAKKIVIE